MKCFFQDLHFSVFYTYDDTVGNVTKVDTHQLISKYVVETIELRRQLISSLNKLSMPYR